ncbi:MAG: protein kinase [Myxococcota bacterium]|nr:protein kinase [Myxococcota bacterium]
MSDPSSTPSQNADQVRAYGKYVLVRKLAEGGMAEIFLAKQVGAEGFERNVVIKRMLQNLSHVPDFVGMFLDEARLAAQLSHQNIVQINDLGLADGCYYICMEYLAGEDFSTVVRAAGKNREYVPVNVVCRVIADAAHGLQFAHDFKNEQGQALGVVHRDISPSNLYVTFSGQVKVLDFGIAKAESRVTQTTAGVVKGKYMYMAPEQARGTGVDRRADVFSLGVSLYEALTNTRPFARDNDLAILNAVLRCDFKPPRQLRPELAVELEAIVLKAMAAKVEDRYPSALALATDLERFLAAQPSVTDAASVSRYLKGLFGEERVAIKTRIPTLQSLVPTGLQLPGFHPDAKTQAASGPKLTPSLGISISEGATRVGSQPGNPAAAPSPGTEPGRARRSSLGVVLLSVAASAVVAVAAVLGMRLLQEKPPPVAEVSAPVAVDSPPALDAVAPASQPELDAGTVLAAGSEPRTGEGPGEERPIRKTPPRPKPVQLDAAAISKVVSGGTGSIMKCFESFKSELPSDQGKVLVKFTIVSSGKVSATEVQGALGSTGVGACLAKNVSRLRFPAHTDREITLTQAFGYTVQR